MHTGNKSFQMYITFDFHILWNIFGWMTTFLLQKYLVYFKPPNYHRKKLPFCYRFSNFFPDYLCLWLCFSFIFLSSTLARTFSLAYTSTYSFFISSYIIYGFLYSLLVIRSLGGCMMPENRHYPTLIIHVLRLFLPFFCIKSGIRL